MNERKMSVGALHVLTPMQVHKAGPGEELLDGGGVALRASPKGSGSWTFRFTSPTTGKRRELGLGPAHRGSLAQAGESLRLARAAAQRARTLIAQGIDPVDAKRERRQAEKAAEIERKAQQARERRTLCRAARDYHEATIEPTRTRVHAANWISSLEHHVPASLWNKPAADVTPAELLAALLSAKPHPRAIKGDGSLRETIKRVRQRLDAVFEREILLGHAQVNPAAAIKRALREAAGRREQTSMRALPFREVPAMMAALRRAEGVSARCLEFTILTACRTNESLFAQWNEVDLDAATWVIPASRYKTREPHVVHLSARALEVLRSMQGLDERYVFPSPMPERAGKPMSSMAMLVTLDRIGYRGRTTVHGVARQTFSTWSYELSIARGDVIEAALGHREADKVKRAYSKAQLDAERRDLLNRWADYLNGAQVIPMPSRHRAA